MNVEVYYIRIEDGYGKVKKYLRFTDKQRALQVYEFIVEAVKDKEMVKLLDNDFNPIIPPKTTTMTPDTIK